MFDRYVQVRYRQIETHIDISWMVKKCSRTSDTQRITSTWSKKILYLGLTHTNSWWLNLNIHLNITLNINLNIQAKFWCFLSFRKKVLDCPKVFENGCCTNCTKNDHATVLGVIAIEYVLVEGWHIFDFLVFCKSKIVFTWFTLWLTGATVTSGVALRRKTNQVKGKY